MANRLPERGCVGCGQTDTDPRHVVVQADQTESPWHLDCHSRVSSGYWGDGPCPSCTEQIAGFNGEGGKALRKHLIGES